MDYKEGDKVTITKTSGKLIVGQAGSIRMIVGTTIWFKSRGKDHPVLEDNITLTKTYNSSLAKALK